MSRNKCNWTPCIRVHGKFPLVLGQRLVIHCWDTHMWSTAGTETCEPLLRQRLVIHCWDRLVCGTNLTIWLSSCVVMLRLNDVVTSICNPLPGVVTPVIMRGERQGSKWTSLRVNRPPRPVLPHWKKLFYCKLFPQVQESSSEEAVWVSNSFENYFYFKIIFV